MGEECQQAGAWRDRGRRHPDAARGDSRPRTGHSRAGDHDAPGGPFGRAAEGDFGTNSDYRNPLLTSRLVAEGYVQQLGRGVRRARTQLEKNGNPPLEVETDGFTRVIVRRRS